jgi:hypothetical protein
LNHRCSPRHTSDRVVAFLGVVVLQGPGR